jgi:hypothetical protein
MIVMYNVRRYQSVLLHGEEHAAPGGGWRPAPSSQDCLSLALVPVIVLIIEHSTVLTHSIVFKQKSLKPSSSMCLMKVLNWYGRSCDLSPYLPGPIPEYAACWTRTCDWRTYATRPCPARCCRQARTVRYPRQRWRRTGRA